MAEFVGGFIDEKVIAQLLKRSIIYSKKDKTVDDIHFMNSRNAWVRIVSSVNLLDEQGNYTSKPAQNFILSNLVSLKENFKEVTEEGKKVNKLDSLSPVLSSGIDFTGRNASKAYNYSPDLGVRPRPGITSFSVISKGRFGTIREANVAFSVWSVEDLDAIERLYFAPGYTCIVEWGHTVYVDKDGNIQTDTSEANKSLLDYFNDSKSQQNIAAILKDKTEKTDYNYQSFFGIIKNFSWSFRPDGGYDCSISVISQGEVLQSLSMNVDNAGPSSQAVQGGSANDQATEKYNRNLIYRFLGDLRSYESNPAKLVRKLDDLSPRVKNALSNEDIAPEKEVQLFSYGTDSTEKIKAIALQQKDATLSPDEQFFYFTLRTLLQLVNKGYIIKDENCKEIAGFDITSKEQYFSFNYHISLDPRVCLLPKQGKIITSGTPLDLIKKYHEELPKVVKGQEAIYTDRILDILITDLLVERALESSGDNVFNFINFILSEITSALGNINEFIISEVQDNFQLEIKDVAVIPSKNTFTKQTEHLLPLSGIKSILTDLNIQSKISKDLVSMISIAAQAGPTKTSEDTVAMTRWNEGRVDRFIGEKSQVDCFDDRSTTTPLPVEQTNDYPASSIIGFYSALQKSQLFQRAKVIIRNFFSQLISTTSSTDERDDLFGLLAKGYKELIYNNGYLQEEFQTAKSKGASEYRLIIYGANPAEIKDKEELTISKGVIPVELSFKTDGIGGLKIGQAFRVSKNILPTRYDEFGYIITGIEHVIENNRWYSSIKSQLFIIPERDIKNQGISTLNLEESAVTLVDLPPLDQAEVNFGEAAADAFGFSEDILNRDRYNAAKILTESYLLGRILTDTEFGLLIRTVAGETSPGARYPLENAAITSVILNRVLSPRYPNSITQVISEPRQFQAVTGTSTSPGPSQVFIEPSNDVVKNIVDSIINNLREYKSKGWLNFTSNQDSAYKDGTDIQFKITALNTPGSQVIGNTVFFTLNNRSNEPSAKQRQQRGSSGASGTF